VTRPILYLSGPYSAGHGRSVTDNIAVARRYAVAAAKAGWMPFTPRGGQHYLYDNILGRIIGEGSARAVRAKAAEWAPFAPRRYRALTVDQVDSRALLDWQRFGTYNPHWVIADGF